LRNYSFIPEIVGRGKVRTVYFLGGGSGIISAFCKNTTQIRMSVMIKPIGGERGK
jgi:hypothetical protein